MNRHSIRLPRPAARRFGLVLIGLLLAGAAAGCSADPGKGPDAAQALQSQVLAVTKSAAANDPASTLKLLDELTAKLDGSAMDGDITFQRHQSIMAAIDALRAELTAQLPAAPGTAIAAPAPAPADVPAPADQAVVTTTSAPVVVAPAPFRAVWRAPLAPPLLQAPPVIQAPVQAPISAAPVSAAPVQAPISAAPVSAAPASAAPAVESAAAMAVQPQAAIAPDRTSRGNGNGGNDNGNGNAWGNGNGGRGNGRG